MRHLHLLYFLLSSVLLSAQNNPAPFIDVNIPRGDNLRVLRLAVSTNGEFTQSVPGSSDAEKVAEVLTQMKAWIEEINEVYGREYCVYFELVPDNLLQQIIYTNAVSDPWPNMSGGVGCNNNGLILNIQGSTIDGAIGAANYDISHVILGNFNGGCAGGFKTGYSGGFDLPVTRHEMGHQFGQPHTINNSGNNNYEPENAGRSIQGGNSHPYAHSSSYHQLADFLNTTQASAGSNIATGNTIPTVDAGPDRAIPISTPFELSATATDPDAGDVLTFAWDQLDRGIMQSLPTIDDSQGALFSRLTPSLIPSRTYPQVSDLVSNNYATSLEVLPTQARDLNFRLTVNDNHTYNYNGKTINASGTNSDDLKITVINSGAPFRVSSQSVAVTYVGASTQTVTWDVSGTNNAPINTTNVKISFSTDGGLSFPITLVASTANDGSASITLPNINTTQARIKVEAIGNYFFDINAVDFTVNQDPGSPGIKIAIGGGSTIVSENGQVDTYEISPLTTPSSAVTISIAADSQSEISLNSTDFSGAQSVVFTNTTAQTIFVRGVSDHLVEGPHLAQIGHMVSNSADPSYPVGMPGQPVLVQISDAQIPPIIGIDFDEVSSGSTPTNWTKITDIRNQNLIDLSLEDGTPTGIDLTTSATNCGIGGCGFGSNGYPLPQHVQSLDPMKGVVYARGNVSFAWSGLKANTAYRVYVFGYGVFGPIDQNVSIVGAGAPENFTQAASSSTLIINDGVASTAPLVSFGKEITSSPTGTITISASSNLGNDEMAFAGIGIQEAFEIPDPCPNELTLIGTNLGDNSDENNRSHNEVSGSIFSNQVIGAGANVTYDAVAGIHLTNGFEVMQNAVFQIIIDGCGGIQ